jgi:hypothetical protein
MEEGIAQVKFPGMGEVGAGLRDGDVDGDEGEATRALVVSHNRKGKKSGGFQSMGKSIVHVVYILGSRPFVEGVEQFVLMSLHPIKLLGHEMQSLANFELLNHR